MKSSVNNMKKVLIVEDDKFLVRVYVRKFMDEGIESIFLENGVRAKEIAKKEQPGLIILDLLMPEKDGFKVLEELSQDPDTKNIPVVVLSALGSEADIKDAFKLGAKEFFVKSNLSLNEFVTSIKKYID